MRKLALLAAVACAVSGAAAADNRISMSMSTYCNSPLPHTPCIYDASGTLVGIPYWENNLMRQIAGHWYQLTYQRSGILLVGNLTLLFTLPNCGGPPMVGDDNTVPDFATYDGQNIWAAVPNSKLAVFNWLSYRYTDSQTLKIVCVDETAACTSQGTCHVVGSQAKIIETRTFTGPFTLQ